MPLRLFVADVKVKKGTEKKGDKVVQYTKFKLRLSRYLYTLKINDPERAKKISESFPPGTDRSYACGSVPFTMLLASAWLLRWRCSHGCPFGLPVAQASRRRSSRSKRLLVAMALFEKQKQNTSVLFSSIPRMLCVPPPWV